NIVAVHANFTRESDRFGDSSNELSSDLVVLGVVSSSVSVKPATTKIDLHAFGDGCANGSAEASLRVNDSTARSFTRHSDGEHVEGALGRTKDVVVGFVGGVAAERTSRTNLEGIERTGDPGMNTPVLDNTVQDAASNAGDVSSDARTGI